MQRLNPVLYDLAMKSLERLRFHQIRNSIIREASGQVLEIGSGTGVNFPYYKKANTVHAIEPDSGMRERSLQQMKKAKVKIKTYEAKAEQLPFAQGTFDQVVATLVFCTIADPENALREIRRVSKSGAKIVFFEHVRSEQVLFGRIQDLLSPLWSKIAGGCQLNRDTLKEIKQSGLTVVDVRSHYKGLFLVIECLNKDWKNESPDYFDLE